MSWHPSAKATRDVKNNRRNRLELGDEVAIPITPMKSNNWLAIAHPFLCPNILDKNGKLNFSIKGAHKNLKVNGN